MTYEEIVLELESALAPEDAVDIVLALMTEAYEEGHAAASRSLMNFRLPQPIVITTTVLVTD